MPLRQIADVEPVWSPVSYTHLDVYKRQAGKRLGFQDERGNVFLKCIEVIREIQPQYAVIENVRGLFSSALSIDIDDEITRSYEIGRAHV